MGAARTGEGMRGLLTKKAPDDSGMPVPGKAHTQPSPMVALEPQRDLTAVLISAGGADGPLSLRIASVPPVWVTRTLPRFDPHSVWSELRN